MNHKHLMSALNEIAINNPTEAENFVNSLLHKYKVEEAQQYYVLALSPEDALHKMVRANKGQHLNPTCDSAIPVGNIICRLVNDESGEVAPEQFTKTELLRISQVAEQWKRSYAYIYSLVRERKIRAIGSNHPHRIKYTYWHIEQSEADRAKAEYA